MSLCTVGWNAKYFDFKKFKVELTNDQQFHFLLYKQKNWKQVKLRSVVYTHVHSIHNSSNVAVSLCSADGWKVKQKVVYTYNGMLVSPDKKGDSNMQLHGWTPRMREVRMIVTKIYTVQVYLCKVFRVVKNHRDSEAVKFAKGARRVMITL